MLKVNKSVESAELITLFPIHPLKEVSLNKTITRHWSNLHLVLGRDEQVLFAWLTFMSDRYNCFEYSTKLLKQYNVSSRRMVELTNSKRVQHNTGINIARKAFIKLIETGYVIRLKDQRFMINPMVVYNSRISGIELQKEYMGVLKSADVPKELVKWCESILIRYKKKK